MKENFWKKILKGVVKTKGFWIGLILGIIVSLIYFFELMPEWLGYILGFPTWISFQIVTPIILSILCTPENTKVFGCLQATEPLLIFTLLLSIFIYAFLGVFIEKIILFFIKLKKGREK